MAVAIIPHRILFFSKEIFKYNRHNLLGHGSYSHVFHGTFRFNEVAFKRIVSTPSLTEDEVKHHKNLNHENVLELLAVIDTNDFR
jgi:serine/threonine protein kinase